MAEKMSNESQDKVSLAFAGLDEELRGTLVAVLNMTPEQIAALPAEEQEVNNQLRIQALNILASHQ